MVTLLLLTPLQPISIVLIVPKSCEALLPAFVQALLSPLLPLHSLLLMALLPPLQRLLLLLPSLQPMLPQPPWPFS